MQVAMFLVPNLVYLLLYFLGLLAANEGKKLEIAGMSRMSSGFLLLIVSHLLSIGYNYYIFVFHAFIGPFLSLLYFISFILGLLGLLFIVLAVREMVSAYKEYLGRPA
ncbi:MAG: hypothetical protein ACP6IS_08300 [Candidatus Asgardarchaeia archaeon]